MSNSSSGGLRKKRKTPKTFAERIYIERRNSPLSIQILYFTLIVFSVFQLLSLVAFSFAQNDTTYHSSTKVRPQAIVEPSRAIVEVKYDWKEDVKQRWGEKADIALAIAYAESGWKVDATGYNCRYGKVVKACKVQDRHLAISTDGGLYQIAQLHGYDEKTLHDPKENIRIAYEIYQKAGNSFTPWYTYRNGKHLKYMKTTQ